MDFLEIKLLYLLYEGALSGAKLISKFHSEFGDVPRARIYYYLRKLENENYVRSTVLKQIPFMKEYALSDQGSAALEAVQIQKDTSQVDSSSPQFAEASDLIESQQDLLVLFQDELEEHPPLLQSLSESFVALFKKYFPETKKESW